MPRWSFPTAAEDCFGDDPEIALSEEAVDLDLAVEGNNPVAKLLKRVLLAASSGVFNVPGVILENTVPCPAPKADGSQRDRTSDDADGELGRLSDSFCLGMRIFNASASRSACLVRCRTSFGRTLLTQSRPYHVIVSAD